MAIRIEGDANNVQRLIKPVPTSKNAQSLESIKALVSQIAYKDWEFEIAMDKKGESRPYLQIHFMDTDHFTGKPERQDCRKWYLSYHMTDSEIVRTAYKAVCTALEHERDELFKYQGVPLFNPHHDLNFLVEFAKKKKIDIRDKK